MADRLSDVLVRKALAPTRGQSILWDSEVKGFGLRVTAGGAKSFILDYRTEGRQRRITIGSYPDWSVAAARNTAKTMKQQVDTGEDPMGERHTQRGAPTILDLFDRYERKHLPQKSARSQVDEKIMWGRIILPRLGKLKVASVTHAEVDALHRDITIIRGTPVRANRTVEVLSKTFNLAIRWGWRSDNPASGVRRNPEEKRNRYLNRAEIAALARALNEHPEITSAAAIKLLMLTGARRGEVLGATWQMFDLENGIWTKPSAHTKQRRVHRVPLSAPALQLLKDLKAAAEGEGLKTDRPLSPYVFPGAEGKSLSDIKKTWLSVCRKAGLADRVQRRSERRKPINGKQTDAVMVWQTTVRLHDLRHSFASILVSAGASLALIGQMLGHTQAQTTHRYAHLFDDPQRKAADIVAEYLIEPTHTKTSLALTR